MTDKELDKNIKLLLADQERLARELWEPIIYESLTAFSNLLYRMRYKTPMLTKELEKILKENDYTYLREIPGRGICGIQRFLFTTGIVWGLDETSKKGRWCFPTMADALMAYFTWNGEGDPGEDWIKYKGMDGERWNKPENPEFA